MIAAIVIVALTESEDLYQVALLIDQLKHDDVQLRINAFKNLETIGMAVLLCKFC